MPIQKNLNVAPYYDDFDPNKNFYKVLYKAGYPVQARELTQQQSIMQDQVEKLASRILAEGDNVVPGEYAFENPVAYVRLSSFTKGIDLSDFVGYTLTGVTSGVVAEVIFSADATDDDDSTLFVSYLGGGTSGAVSSFLEGEVVESSNPNRITATVGVNTVSKPVTTPPIGSGTLFRVSEGSYFVDGMVVRNEAQRIVVSKYDVRPTVIVGFLVIEEIITSSDDSSLLDNSQGSSNFAAPGADRLKITLELVSRDQNAVDPNFIKLTTINQGTILSTPSETVKWDWLYDILAHRTYDESGDYIATDFPVSTMEYWNPEGSQKGLYDPDSETGLYPAVPGSGSTVELSEEEADAYFVLNLAPGEAYVRGYEIEYTNNTYLYGNKSRGTSFRENALTQITDGYNLKVTNLFSTPDFANISGEGTAIAFSDVVLYRNFIDGYVGESADANGRPLNIGNKPWKTYHVITDGDIGSDPTGFTEIYKEGNSAVVNTPNNLSRGDIIGDAVILIANAFSPAPAGVLRPRYLIPNELVSSGDGFYGYNSTYKLGSIDSVYFNELAIAEVTNSSTAWVVGDLVFGEQSGAVATVEEGSGERTLIVSAVDGEFILGEDVVQGDKVSRILQDSEISGFQFTDKGANNTTVDLSSETSISISAVGATTTLTVADGDIVAYSDRIELTDLGGEKLRSFPYPEGSVSNVRVNYSVVTGPSLVNGYGVGRRSSINNNITMTKSLFSTLGDTEDFSADISIQNSSDAEIINIANNSQFSGDVGSNTLTCDNFSGDPSVQLIAGDVITFVDDTGRSISAMVFFATQPIGYGETRSKSTIYITTTLPNAVTGKTVQRIRVRARGKATDTLLFPLPQEVVATLETNSDRTGIDYQVLREFIVNTQSGGNTVTLTTNKTNEVFISDINKTSLVISENISSPADPNSLVGRGLTVASIDTSQDDGRKVVYTLNTTLSSSVKVKVLVPMLVSNATAKRKIYRENQLLNVSASDAAKSIISLKQADVFRVNSVLENGVDILPNYVFDDGQRDNIYDISRLVLKERLPLATGDLLISYDYFEHSGDGDFFSVNSYTSDDQLNYKNIPTYTSLTTPKKTDDTQKSNEKSVIQLRDSIDFRPVVNTTGDSSVIVSITDGVGAQGSKNFRDSNNGGNGFAPRLPVVGTQFQCNMEYYLPHYESIFIESNGTISVIAGESSADPSPAPALATAIRIYDVYVPSYTFNLSDIYIKKFNYKRYQMKDIAVIDRQVQKLTQLVSLSLLEQDAINTSVRDATTGLDRYKNGIVVDNFTTHANGEVNSEQYRCSIDGTRGYLRSPYFLDQVELEEKYQVESDRAVRGYKISESGIITLNYVNVDYISNPFATRHINLQPFSIFTYDGSLELSPSIDTFQDITTQPELVVENNALYDAMLASGFEEELTSETVWGSWHKLTNEDALNNFDPNDFAIDVREGVTTTTGITSSVVETSFGERITDVQLAKTMRTIAVAFFGTNVKPNTEYFAFFDGVDVTPWVCPDAKSDDYPDGIERYSGKPNQTPLGFGLPILSDASGNLQGIFLVPNGRAPVAGSIYSGVLEDVVYQTEGPSRSFNTGSSILRFTDVQSNPSDLSLVGGICEAEFTSTGVLLDTQETIVATRVPEYTTTTTVVTESSEPYDPVAQTFSVSVEDGAPGAFVTELDLFLRTKDPVDGMEVYMVTTQGQVPTETIIPHTRVTKNTDTVIRVVAETLVGDATVLEAGTIVRGSISGSTGSLKSGVVFESATQNSDKNITNKVYYLVLDNYNGEFVAGEQIVPQVSPELSDVFFIAKDELDVTKALLTSLGSGYTTASVTFSAPNLPGGIQAAGTVEVSNGMVYNLKVTERGSGYTSVPSATITGDGLGAYVEVRVQPGEKAVIMGVATSDDATVPTTFRFKAPVYLMANTYYAVVIKAPTSLNYTVWTSKLGETIIGTDTRVTSQPLLGALFMSQNGGLWTEDQNQDVMFNLRRASFFTGTPGLVSLQNERLVPRQVAIDPIETNTNGTDTSSPVFGDNPSVVLVYHSKHGNVTGDKVAIAGVTGNPGGIPNTELNAIHTVIDSDFDTFTIQVSTSATSSRKAGGNTVTTTYNRPYEVINVYTGIMGFGNTTLSSTVRTLQAEGVTGYNFSTAYQKDGHTNLKYEQDMYYTGPKQIAGGLNEAANPNTLKGDRSLEITNTLTTKNDYVSPVLDLVRTNANVIHNLVDNPQVSDEIYGATTRTLTYGDDISASGLSVGDDLEFTVGEVTRSVGIRSLNTATRKIQVSGQYASLLTTDTTVTNATLQAAGITKATTVQDGGFVPETSVNGTVYSKWISRLFLFEDPCDGIEVKISAIFYSTDDIRVYYRPRVVGFDGDMNEVNWIPFNETGLPNDVDLITPRSSDSVNPGRFKASDWQGLTWTTQDISPFEGVSVKIVMTSDNPAQTPIIDDIQIIASE